MSRAWFSGELETVATYWRLVRQDGVTLGFTSHDADLWFGGVLHQAAPGMMPAAIRRTAGFSADSTQVEGVISHDAIAAFDLEAGRYDLARIAVGVVDWSTLEFQPLYSGSIGTVSEEAAGFVAKLQSRKAELLRDPVPRTSPTCRADFCGKGCGLSAAGFTHEAVLLSHAPDSNLVTLSSSATPAMLLGGSLRWADGPYAGLTMGILGQMGSALLLDWPIDLQLASGLRAMVREGCDHTLTTCTDRFANAMNFQGEPFLPGNDLMVRYGLAS